MATFRTNSLILPGLYILIGRQKRIDGARASWSSILLLITVVRKKNLKLKKQDFLSHSLLLMAFRLGRGRGGRAPWLRL